ncbi:MAG: 50S ribosomal protein L32, partial [Deltaproteobacteria bacterium]|nr:50S ribosomal protein L32 [Deltaproteobacteria bacterium]
MPVPKRRTSKRKKNQRRSHDALTKPQWSTCPKCGEALLPHRA